MTYLNAIAQKLSSRSPRFATLLRHAQRGVSAVEFALIAPLMILMLFGAMEICLLVTVDRKTTIAASTLGDLAAQTDIVSCVELAQIGAVTRQVFEPYSGADATLVVASLTLNGGAAKVEWSKFVQTVAGVTTCNNVPNDHSLKVGNTVVVDTSLFAAGGGGLVVGDVEKVHTTLGTSFLDTGLRMHERFYLRPRKSLKLRLCLDTGPNVTAANCTTTT